MSKTIIKFLVNLITTSRFIGSIILICLFPYVSTKFFLICIIILFLTDWIDGFLARKFHVESIYGSLMDTIADKTLNIILIVPLIKTLPLILGILILEIGIMLTNVIGKLKGKKVSTNYYGKIKMWFVAVSIIGGYFVYFNYIHTFFINFIILLTMMMQILTIINYVIYFNKQIVTKNKKDTKNKRILQILFDTEYYLEEKENFRK